jgi:hypothetical protein
MRSFTKAHTLLYEGAQVRFCRKSAPHPCVRRSRVGNDVEHDVEWDVGDLSARHLRQAGKLRRYSGEAESSRTFETTSANRCSVALCVRGGSTVSLVEPLEALVNGGSSRPGSYLRCRGPDEMDVGDGIATETSDIELVAFTNDRRTASM